MASTVLAAPYDSTIVALVDSQSVPVWKNIGWVNTTLPAPLDIAPHLRAQPRPVFVPLHPPFNTALTANIHPDSVALWLAKGWVR